VLDVGRFWPSGNEPNKIQAVQISVFNIIRDRIMSLARLFAVFLVLLTGTSAAAADQDATAKANILANFPELESADISASPIAGLYEVGRYLIRGDIYDSVTEENLTEARRTLVRVNAVENVGENSMIVFSPEAEQVKHTITVFTDIDCGYCRKLHRQIDDYNGQGIKVRYLFFPRSGPDTQSWHKAEHVWCADDRHSALTRAKAGEPVQSDGCGTTPVQQHYLLGQAFGITGTPAIVVDTGELIPGYVAPNELSKYLGE
jgi:thiol:disulfide interchange protein DsbC